MDVYDDSGQPVRGEVGELVCKRPWPGMTRGLWRDPERFLETYWERFPGVWTHGDWASVDEDGYWFLHGRSDDTLNIAGKRIGPAELESAAVNHPSVTEAAAIGVPHEVKGEVPWLFCVLRPGEEALPEDVARAVTDELGKSFKPERVFFVSALPKTRSAKIVRRAVRARRARRGSPETSRRSRTPSHWRRSHVPSDPLDGVALVTGGGRGIGASIARELTKAGMRVAVTARTREQAEAVAAEIDGLALTGDVSRIRRRRGVGGANGERARPDRPPRRQRGHRQPGRSDVGGLGRGLVAGARSQRARRAPLVPPVIPGMLERGSGRIVITGSGSAYLPGGGGQTAYPTSKAAACRYGEILANELRDRIPVFVISPGLVRTDMTERFGDDMPWTPPELAPELVRVLASGRADALAGRYLHAEHDDIEDLIRRAGEVVANDLNAIRLQR